MAADAVDWVWVGNSPSFWMLEGSGEGGVSFLQR